MTLHLPATANRLGETGNRGSRASASAQVRTFRLSGTKPSTGSDENFDRVRLRSPSLTLTVASTALFFSLATREQSCQKRIISLSLSLDRGKIRCREEPPEKSERETTLFQPSTFRRAAAGVFVRLEIMTLSRARARVSRIRGWLSNYRHTNEHAAASSSVPNTFHSWLVAAAMWLQEGGLSLSRARALLVIAGNKVGWLVGGPVVGVGGNLVRRGGSRGAGTRQDLLPIPDHPRRNSL